MKKGRTVSPHVGQRDGGLTWSLWVVPVPSENGPTSTPGRNSEVKGHWMISMMSLLLLAAVEQHVDWPLAIT